MAVIKIVNREVGKTYALKAVLDYIKNPKKTENGNLVSAKDCLLECDYAQMLATKLDYHQDTGRQYIHLIQSFSEFDKLDAKTAHSIGQKLLERFDGFQGVVATHTDKKQLHNHIVLNSVNWQTGRKWQHSKQDLLELRKFSDKLCKEYGLSIISNRNSWQKSGEYQAGEKSWKYMLAQDISRAIEKSFSTSDFIHRLDEIGIDVDFGERNIMFRVSKESASRYGLDKAVSCQNFKLSAYGDFSRDNILNSIEYNDYNLETGLIGIHQGGEIFDELAQMDIWGDDGDMDIHGLYQAILQEIEFKGKPWYQIQTIIAQLQADQAKRKLVREGLLSLKQYQNQTSRPQVLFTSVCEMLEEFIHWRNQRYNSYMQENYYTKEYQYEDDWEL